MDASQPELILRQLTQVAEGSLSRTLIHFPESLSLEFSANRRADGGAVLIFEDVSSRVKAEQKILHMVRYRRADWPSQSRIFRPAGAGVPRPVIRRRRGPLGFMVLDIDEFKHVNDMRGHVTGDHLLCAIAARIKDDGRQCHRRPPDGRPIHPLLPACEGAAKRSTPRSAGCTLTIQGNYEVDEITFLVSLSAGYAILESNAFAMDEWSIKADLALFESKSRLTRRHRRLRARNGRPLHRAAEAEGGPARGGGREASCSLVFQPMFKADGTRIECAEALARWVHPEKGSIPPDVFIRIAEEMGIISDITRFVLFKACSECMTWPEHIAVSVNLSARDLRDADILAVVSEALAQSGLAASRLHLEITESCLIDEPAAVRAILAELRVPRHHHCHRRFRHRLLQPQLSRHAAARYREDRSLLRAQHR